MFTDAGRALSRSVGLDGRGARGQSCGWRSAWVYSKAMASSPDRVRSDALSLPSQERARLAHDLILSLDDAEDPGAAEEWVTEIERRASEVEPVAAPLEDWAAVRARWAARWRKP